MAEREGGGSRTGATANSVALSDLVAVRWSQVLPGAPVLLGLASCCSVYSHWRTSEGDSVDESEQVDLHAQEVFFRRYSAACALESISNKAISCVVSLLCENSL